MRRAEQAIAATAVIVAFGVGWCSGSVPGDEDEAPRVQTTTTVKPTTTTTEQIVRPPVDDTRCAGDEQPVDYGNGVTVCLHTEGDGWHVLKVQ
jgi:hypothetical protein